MKISHTSKTLIKKEPSMKIVHVFTGTKHPQKQALRFSTLLAVNKGYTSKIVKIKGGYRVIASDGKAVDFLR